MGRLQPLSAKLGEVKFRKKITQQLKGERVYYPHYLKSSEIIGYLKRKSLVSLKIFQQLKKGKIPLNPFVDIGAGFCHRTAVLSSKLNCQGFAIDISAKGLQSAPYFCRQLGLKTLPVRICADAYNLPFTNNSLPFVFIFETLHHFPDPKPIIQEAYRILSPGGYFYIGAEPVRRWAHFSLWRRDGYHLRWWEKILKSFIILHFISSPGKSEVSEGVLEETFDLPTWEKALNEFDRVQVEFVPFPFGPKSKIKKKGRNGWFKPKLSTKLMIGLVGGGMNSLCQKKGEFKKKSLNILDLLACPSCKKKLTKEKDYFKCAACREKYPIKNGIIYLLTPNLRKKLYP